LKIKKPNFSGFLGFKKNLKNLGFFKWVSTALVETRRLLLLVQKGLAEAGLAFLLNNVWQGTSVKS